MHCALSLHSNYKSGAKIQTNSYFKYLLFNKYSQEMHLLFKQTMWTWMYTDNFWYNWILEIYNSESGLVSLSFTLNRK